jgi:hypothetical protein
MHGVGPEAVAIVGSCGVTRKRFLIEAELANGVLTCKSARSITPEHAAQLEANLTVNAPQTVTMAAAFVCPECGSSHSEAMQAGQCTGCKVFHCAGRNAEGYVLGACGRCRFTTADFGPYEVVVHAVARY